MDAVFALAAAHRERVLERAAARVPGCLYLCLWAPVIAGLPSSHLFCLGAWMGDVGGGDRGARARAMFDAYRGALCAAVSGCVPGWAYKEGRPYMEVPEPDLTASASLQVQQQFCHEAGIKMAMFMGCEAGEIEVGLSVASAAGAAVANHVQLSILAELLLLPAARPSSSSSSLPSISVGSPEYSSLIRSISTAPGPTSTQAPQPSPLHGPRDFPSAEADDDAAIAQAMLAVISSSYLPTAPTTLPPPPPSPPWLARRRSRSTSPRRATAFKAYNPALSPRARPRPGAPGKRMIKTCISLLLTVHTAARNQLELAAAHREEGVAPAPPTSSQLHHMISERRRRERLNDSFHTLGTLLPPGSKKDKANVLASTTEYMHKLISQMSELREKNRQLEAQLLLQRGGEAQTTSDDGSSERVVQVDVTTGASTSASAPDQPGEVSVRLTVRAEIDMSELLISLLARFKEMGRFAVVSMDARQPSSALSQAMVTLRVTDAGDVNETSLKEAVIKVVQDAMTTKPPEAP